MEQDWVRPRYAPGGGDASVLFAVFGPKPEPLRVTSLAHRVVPMELSLELEYQDAQAAAAILASPAGETLLAGWEGDPPDALAADGCMVMRADVPDPPDLRYLRNCVGVVTAILEAGGRAAANLQSLGMVGEEQWRAFIFAPDLPQPRLHVNVFHAREEGGMWLRSRGMRSFGRPDLSLHGVPPDALEAGAALCNRLIEAQAFGAVLRDGEPVEAEGPGLHIRAQLAGSPDDPLFDNRHLELSWP